MKYVIDHDLHMHSQLSECSSHPQQTPQALLNFALDNHLSTICLTDHYWDDTVPGPSPWYAAQDDAHVRQNLPLPQAEGVRFLFGCETDMDKHGVIGISREKWDDFDFIIVPISHLHMSGFTLNPEDGDTAEKRAKLLLKRFEAFVNADLPFHKVGLAHFTCSLIMHANDEYLKVLDLIPDEDYVRLFKICAQKGCGIELNISLSELKNPAIHDSLLRPYRIAKQQGCKFYLGCDTHTPQGSAEAMERFQLMVDLLDLTEDDKFHI